MTIIAFDFGTKSIGAAIGESITRVPRPLCAFKAQDGIPNWAEIEKVIKEWQPAKLIVGLPLNNDGTEQELTFRAKKFANRLHGRFGLPVVLQDERLTTIEAKATLFEHGGYRSLSKKNIDAMAATIILTSWFEENALSL